MVSEVDEAARTINIKFNEGIHVLLQAVFSVPMKKTQMLNIQFSLDNLGELKKVIQLNEGSIHPNGYKQRINQNRFK